MPDFAFLMATMSGVSSPFFTFYNFENSGSARRTWQGGPEEPADEFRLTVGFGFRENVLRVGARRRLGDFEPRGGGEKPVCAYDFPENACLGEGQPESCAEVLDLGAEAGGRDCHAERAGCCSRPGEEFMDRRRALQMRREGFQEMPFRGFYPHRAGRSMETQVAGLFGRVKKTNADDIGPSLRHHKSLQKAEALNESVWVTGVADRTSPERLPPRLR